jgi:hypothetical protein
MMDAPSPKLTVQLPLVSLYGSVGSVFAKYASIDSVRCSGVGAFVVHAATGAFVADCARNTQVLNAVIPTKASDRIIRFMIFI